MVRIDMSEYMEKHAVSRLVGAPPGYVGYEEGGQLTEAVRRRPYSVLLLDEIEKAHPDVFNVLLQLLDDGRLTDGQGRTVDFRNTIVIMTSNLGSRGVPRHLVCRRSKREGRGPRGRARALPARVPEPGRRDRRVRSADARATSRRSWTSSSSALASALAERKLTLELTDAAREYLANDGYDPAFGARPLKRVIQREIQDPLALALLSGEIHDGDEVVIDAGEGGLVLRAPTH